MLAGPQGAFTNACRVQRVFSWIPRGMQLTLPFKNCGIQTTVSWVKLLTIPHLIHSSLRAVSLRKITCVLLFPHYSSLLNVSPLLSSWFLDGFSSQGLPQSIHGTLIVPVIAWNTYVHFLFIFFFLEYDILRTRTCLSFIFGSLMYEVLGT